MKFNKIFSSNAVLPAGKTLLVYGTGDGEGSVEFAGQINKVVATDGKWSTTFPAMTYGGPYTMKLVSDEGESVIDNIYVGEVYLCAGQSNIELKLKDTNTPKEEHKSIDLLRGFFVDKITANGLFALDSGWVKAESDTVYDWTAIGYLAGKEISEKKNIAVGMISCSQGASIIESWVPEGTFESIGINIPIDKKAVGHTMPEYQKWNKFGALYEKQFRQVFPYQLNGVIWYQGESDAVGPESEVYHLELEALIKKWREDFGDGDLPFYVVQLHDYFTDDWYRDNDGWRRIQAAQMKIQEMTHNVKTVISKDICETDDIHPQTKTVLSKRIAEAIMENK
ncbi:MAG: sialate O-acetylesterase [Ruminococcaceae bacterium]|nr:sialate O-acetylesterase [Oscillospiraceae bacterium]